MIRTVYRISIMLHALCIAGILATSSTAAADSSTGREADDDRWIPSLALVLGFTTQQNEGRANAAELINPDPFPGPNFVSDQNASTGLHIGGSLAIETPRLFSRGPRLFIEGEILHLSAQSRGLVRDGDPGEFINPPGGIDFSDLGIRGQGSELSADLDNIQYGASVGLSIPIQIGDWHLAIKPSARYLKQKMFLNGELRDAERTDLPPFAPPTEKLVLLGDQSLDLHAVGPGLEIEIEAIRIRSLAASIYVSGGAYRVLSDRRHRISVTGFSVIEQAVPVPGSSFTATFSTDIDAWLYRASLGFRVKWLGLQPGWISIGSRTRSE